MSIEKQQVKMSIEKAIERIKGIITDYEEGKGYEKVSVSFPKFMGGLCFVSLGNSDFIVNLINDVIKEFNRLQNQHCKVSINDVIFFQTTDVKDNLFKFLDKKSPKYNLQQQQVSPSNAQGGNNAKDKQGEQNVEKKDLEDEIPTNPILEKEYKKAKDRIIEKPYYTLLQEKRREIRSIKNDIKKARQDISEKYDQKESTKQDIKRWEEHIEKTVAQTKKSMKDCIDRFKKSMQQYINSNDELQFPSRNEEIISRLTDIKNVDFQDYNDTLLKKQDIEGMKEEMKKTSDKIVELQNQERQLEQHRKYKETILTTEIVEKIKRSTTDLSSVKDAKNLLIDLESVLNYLERKIEQISKTHATCLEKQQNSERQQNSEIQDETSFYKERERILSRRQDILQKQYEELSQLKEKPSNILSKLKAKQKNIQNTSLKSSNKIVNKHNESIKKEPKIIIEKPDFTLLEKIELEITLLEKNIAKLDLDMEKEFYSENHSLKKYSEYDRTIIALSKQLEETKTKQESLINKIIDNTTTSIKNTLNVEDKKSLLTDLQKILTHVKNDEEKLKKEYDKCKTDLEKSLIQHKTSKERVLAECGAKHESRKEQYEELLKFETDLRKEVPINNKQSNELTNLKEEFSKIKKRDIVQLISSEDSERQELNNSLYKLLLKIARIMHSTDKLSPENEERLIEIIDLIRNVNLSNEILTRQNISVTIPQYLEDFLSNTEDKNGIFATHNEGVHYVAWEKDKNGDIIIYNSSSNYDIEKTPMFKEIKKIIASGKNVYIKNVYIKTAKQDSNRCLFAAHERSKELQRGGNIEYNQNKIYGREAEGEFIQEAEKFCDTLIKKNNTILKPAEYKEAIKKIKPSVTIEEWEQKKQEDKDQLIAQNLAKQEIIASEQDSLNLDNVGQYDLCSDPKPSRFPQVRARYEQYNPIFSFLDDVENKYKGNFASKRDLTSSSILAY